jgi:ribosomal protein S18 acetylase RimI-like enzyme
VYIGDNHFMKLPEGPAGLDVTWSPATPADAPTLSALFNVIAEADDTPERLSPETMEHELISAFDPLQQRTLVVRAAGEVVGYGTVYHRDSEATELRSYVGVYVAPAYRERGLEDEITGWVIRAAAEILASSVAAEKYICAWLYKQQEEAASRLERRGFEPVRHWWEMERLLDEDIVTSAARGIDVIPWADEHSMPVRLVANAAFADHWGSTPMDEEAWRKRMLDSPGFRQDLSFVAAVGDELVGYSYNEVYEEDWEAAGRSEGWIGGLGVLREWRKRGAATALLGASMNAMRAAGLDAAMIGVDSSSPSGAQHLYQAVGFRTKSRGSTWQLAADEVMQGA